VEERKGIWLAVAAYTFWGVIPIFWKTLDTVPAVELLSHRIVWSVPLLLAIIVIRGRLPQLRSSYRSKDTTLTALLAGLLLAVNWGVFVWAITTGHIVDASLGYFINPLVSVGLGVLVLREHLSVAQRIAIAIAAVGVMAMTVLVGVLPWIALVLAFSFGIYGLLKKREAAAGPIEGLFMETLFVMVPAVVYLIFVAGDGTGAFGSSPSMTILLIAAGAVTIFPLLLFGAAAKRIPLSTLGILQYLAPTLQLLVGVFIYRETVSGGEWFGFVLVWIALAVYTVDNVRRLNATRVPGPAKRSDTDPVPRAGDGT
jgi:chloramphenicol-sensitive protein RarD